MAITALPPQDTDVPIITEVGHEAPVHTVFPPFDASNFPSQIVWLAITFGALYYYLSKRFLPAVGSVIETRRARIAKDIDEATELQQKATAEAAALDKSLADARAKAQSHAQAARDKLSAEADAKRKTVEDDLAARLAASERQIAATRADAMANVAGIAEEAAAAIVERLIGHGVDRHVVAGAVDASRAN